LLKKQFKVCDSIFYGKICTPNLLCAKYFFCVAKDLVATLKISVLIPLSTPTLANFVLIDQFIDANLKIFVET